MKNLFYYISLLCLASLLACNSDNEKPYIPIPEINNKANLQVNVSLAYISASIENKATNEKINFVDNKAKDANSMAIAIYDENKTHLSLDIFDASDILKLSAGNNLKLLYNEIELGTYYMTIVVNMSAIENLEAHYAELTLDYDEVIVKANNFHVYYLTQKLDLYVKEGAHVNKPILFVKDILLKQMHQNMYVLSVDERVQITEGQTVEMKNTLQNLPIAFWAKDGQTLTNVEHQHYGLQKQTVHWSSILVPIDEDKDGRVETSYLMLDNSNLPNDVAELGKFVAKFDALDGSPLSQLEYPIVQKAKTDFPIYWYSHGIYSGQGKEIGE